MERTEVLDMMGTLKLFGMKTAYDETLATTIKRKHEPQRFVGDLLKAEISEKQARSIRYQMTIAKLPLAKDIDDFAFKGTPINEGLVRDLAGGNFVVLQRNVVLVGGTGTGKTHLAIAIALSCIRSGSRGRFFNTVDLVNRLEAEGRLLRQGLQGCEGLRGRRDPRQLLHARVVLPRRLPRRRRLDERGERGRCGRHRHRHRHHPAAGHDAGRHRRRRLIEGVFVRRGLASKDAGPSSFCASRSSLDNAPEPCLP